MSTLGLSKCYERVGARMGKSPPRGGWGQGPQDVLYTSEDGTLRLGPHLPLFMNRCGGELRGGGGGRGRGLCGCANVGIWVCIGVGIKGR